MIIQIPQMNGYRYQRGNWMNPGKTSHDGGIKWKHFLCYWPFGRLIHWWLVNSPHSDSELWCLFDLRLDKQLSKWWRRRWLGMPMRSLWRHSNALCRNNIKIYPTSMTQKPVRMPLHLYAILVHAALSCVSLLDGEARIHFVTIGSRYQLHLLP